MKLAKRDELTFIIHLESTVWGDDHIGFKVRRYDTDLRRFIREGATLETLKEVMIKVAAGLL